MKKTYGGDIFGHTIYALSIFVPYLFELLFGVDYGIEINRKLIIGVIIYEYILSFLLVRIFYFKQDYYEVFVPTRILKRRIRVYYSDIETIYYTTNRGTSFFAITPKGKKWFIGPYGPSSVLYCERKKKANAIMHVFKSKGLDIELRGFKKKDFPTLMDIGDKNSNS